MNRAEKEVAVAELATDISEAEAIFAIDYRGISVPQAAELRSKLREADTTFRVSKNRLAKLAAAKAGQEGLDEVLTGPTALAFVRGDVAQAAKTLTTFSRENDVLTYKGGLLGDLSVDEDRFKSIARLPGREVLYGQLAGTVASPLTGLARGLNAMISGLAIALGQVAEKGLVGQGAPAGDQEVVDGADSSAHSTQQAESQNVREASDSADDAQAEEATTAEPAATSEPSPEGSGSEAEQPSVDETPNPDPEASADDSSATGPEGEPSEVSSETPAADETPAAEAAVADNKTSQNSENDEE